MDEYTLIQELKHYYAELPEDLRSMFRSQNTIAWLDDVASRRRLSVEQTIAAENEILMVLLGITNTEHLADAIAQSAGLDTADAELIAQKAHDVVIHDARDELSALSRRAHAATELASQSDTNRETEEDWSHMKREQLLSEIENPTPSTPRAPDDVEARGYDEGEDPYREPVE